MSDAVGNRIKLTSTNSVKAYRADSNTSGLWHMDEPVKEGAITVVDASARGNDLAGGCATPAIFSADRKNVIYSGGKSRAMKTYRPTRMCAL